MQSIVYGFAGIRIRPTQLEFHNPTPPPGCTKTWLRGLKYLGTNMTVLIDSAANKVTITVHTINTNYPLVLRRNGTSTVEELSVGKLCGFFLFQIYVAYSRLHDHFFIMLAHLSSAI
jgi:hypothetical protein